jgi:hypothetical protein
MKDNQMLNNIIELLKRENIEILNIANEKESGHLLSFLYKNNLCYITNEGYLSLDKLSGDDELKIKRIIIYAQRMANIDKVLPIQNIDEEKLEVRIINGVAYRLLIQIKNVCMLYRTYGVFGIEYLLCEQKRAGNNYQYKNIAIYSDIRVVEQNLATRTNLMIKPFNIFTNEELKTILYYINIYKSDEKSKNLDEKTERIKRTIIEVLKGEESG